MKNQKKKKVKSKCVVKKKYNDAFSSSKRMRNVEIIYKIKNDPSRILTISDQVVSDHNI